MKRAKRNDHLILALKGGRCDTEGAGLLVDRKGELWDNLSYMLSSCMFFHSSPIIAMLTAPITDLAAYAGLFASALLAATVAPMQSEAVLVALLLGGDYSIPWLLVVASCGNILGALLNWLLGRWIERFRQRRWFPANAQQLERTQGWYQRYGKWSLLLSWVPIIGDPLTVVAGVMREPLPIFLTLVTVAKTGRYLVLTAVTLHWLS